MIRIPTIYKCQACDTVVEVIDEYSLELVCCGREMLPLGQKTARPWERHAPTMRWGRGGLTVRIGADNHPMTAGHQIVWIEVVAANRSLRMFLEPGDRPEAFFEMPRQPVVVRWLCNTHGLFSTGRPKGQAGRFVAEAKPAEVPV